MHALAKTKREDYAPIPAPDIPQADFTALAEQFNKQFTVGVK